MDQQEVDEIARIVAMRTERKLGRKARLRVVSTGNIRSMIPSAPQRSDVFDGQRSVIADVDFDAIDNSPRARKVREILRIADTHGWRSAITFYLDTRGESHIADLTDPQLDDLHDRMLGYLDAAETGCSLADCLPAN